MGCNSRAKIKCMCIFIRNPQIQAFSTVYMSFTHSHAQNCTLAFSLKLTVYVQQRKSNTWREVALSLNTRWSCASFRLVNTATLKTPNKCSFVTVVFFGDPFTMKTTIKSRRTSPDSLLPAPLRGSQAIRRTAEGNISPRCPRSTPGSPLGWPCLDGNTSRGRHLRERRRADPLY